MTFNLISYNCTGLKSPDKYHYVKNNLCNDNNNIVFLQEHWLHEKQLCKLNELGLAYHATCGMHDDENIIVGRPYGGTAILWDKSLSTFISKLDSPNKRSTCIIYNNGNLKILIASLYMPCDPRSNSVTSVEEYASVLDDLSSIIHVHGITHIIIGGDLNTDMKRGNAQCNALELFMHRENLLLGWQCSKMSESVPDKDTYFDSVGNSSCIDHFLFTENIADRIEKGWIRHDIDNRSNHCPIGVSIDLTQLLNFIDKDIEEPHINLTSKVDFSKASQNDIDHYITCLEGKLANIELDDDLLCCKYTSCKAHNKAIDTLCGAIIDACLQAGNVAIPIKGIKTNKQPIPGWSEQVEKFRTTALWWHQLWIANNRPRHGAVADVRRATRSRYHLAIKQCRKKEEYHRKCKFADSLLLNGQDYWKEVKKVKRISNCNSHSVGGLTDNKNIADLFAQEYNSLFNSAPSEPEVMNNILDTISNTIDDNVYNNQFNTVSILDVHKGIDSLRKGKSDGSDGMCSDHVIYASRSTLSVYISLLFTVMNRHGYFPERLSLSTMIPIPKDQRLNLSLLNNYRAITLNNCLNKLYEVIVLHQCRRYLQTSDLQFGFKEGCSTNLCTFVMKEVIEHYNAEGSDVYAIFLDASKAFDKVGHARLFKKLLNRQFPPLILRVLMNMYSSQKGQVKWNNSVSDKFNISNGVRQGGILSPHFYNIFVDELYKKLEICQSGCFMGTHYTGIIGYADDVTILAPSAVAAQKLLNICSEFCIDNGIVLNEKKSKLHIFSKHLDVQNIPSLYVTLNNNNGILEKRKILFDKNPLHLGHHLDIDNSDDRDILFQRASFCRNANAILSDFCSLSSESKYRLLMTYCNAFYGSQIWNLSNKQMCHLHAAIRIATRKAFGLDKRTHNNIIEIISGRDPSELMFQKRFVRFFFSCLEQKNPIVRYLAARAEFCHNSIMGQNVRYINYLYGCNLHYTGVVTVFKIMRKKLSEYSDDVLRIASVVLDLVRCRDFSLDLVGLSTGDLNEILREICTE